MKNFSLLIICFLLNTGIAQNWYSYNFDGDDPTDSPWPVFSSLYIDTASNPNNIWQIGLPQKPDFGSAYTPPNVIITDTVNNYPINDTSSFVIVHQTDFGISMPSYFAIGGYYSVDSDTLTDFGLIQLSHDGGLTWLNIFKNEYVLDLNSTSAYSHIPVLTGNSNGWIRFQIEMTGLYQHLAILLPGQPVFDTLLIRYSFISDDIQTNKAGLMFDSLFVIDTPPIKIEEFQVDPFQIFPNPSLGQFRVIADENIPLEFELVLYDQNGKQVKIFMVATTDDIFDVSDLPKGNYNVLLKSNGHVVRSNIIIQ